MALFRHKTIRTYSVNGFDFKNFEMRLHDERDADRIAQFEELVKKLPPYEAIHIVRVNEEAQAAAEVKLVDTKSPVVRGAMNASDILTAKDRERIAAADAKANGESKGDNGGAGSVATSVGVNLGSKPFPAGIGSAAQKLGVKPAGQ